MTSTHEGRGAAEARSQLGHVARGGAIGLVGAVAAGISGFALVLVVTNSYSTALAGTFFAATAAFFILVSVATLGIDTGLARFLPRYESLGRSGDVSLAVRAAFRPVMLLAAVLSLGVLLLAAPLSDLMGLGAEGAQILQVLALALPAAVVADACLAGTRAFGRMRTTTFLDKMVRAGGQTLLVLGAAVLGAGVVGATWAWSLPYLVAAAMSAVAFQRMLHGRAGSGRGETSDYRAVRREFWSFTWPRGLTRLAQMAIQRADILLVAALRSPAEAAVYTAATRFVPLGQLGTQAIQQVLQPRFAALLATDDRETLGIVYRISTAWAMALSWPLYLVVGAAPLLYLGLFGEEYQEQGGTVVVTMAAAMLLAVATGAVDTLLLMHGKSALSMVNAYVALAIDLVLCLALIPSMGILGAAVAWAVAVATRCLLAVLQVWRFLGLNSFGPGVLIVAMTSAACFALPLLVVQLLGWNTSTQLLLVAGFGCVLYVCLLWAARDVLHLGALGALLRRRSDRPDVEGTDA